jgi:hypothetical protein
VPPETPTARPAHRVNLFAAGIRKELTDGGPKVQTEWIRDSLTAAATMTNGQPLRIPWTAYQQAAKLGLRVKLEIDDFGEEITVTVVGPDGKPVQAPVDGRKGTADALSAWGAEDA